ncbi:MAG: rhodanese-like domain-containing protein [Nitrospirae bacterium]|nr:MAG: rhodanese-like domain-containing protein [Nitrospirota bacterium]
MMKRSSLYFVLVLALLFMMSGLVSAQVTGEPQIASRCKRCHVGSADTIWGLLRAGSQGDSSFDVLVNDNVWKVEYDKRTILKKLQSIKQLRNEEAVRVKFVKSGEGRVYAKEIAYKPNLSFIPANAIMEIGDLAELLKKDPEEANYVLFDVRGVGDYKEGHLPRAVSLPYYRFYYFKDRLPKDKSTLIITYCNSYG